MAIGSRQKMELKIVGSEYTLPVTFMIPNRQKNNRRTIYGTLNGRKQ